MNAFAIASLKPGTIHTWVYTRHAKLPKKLEGNDLVITSCFQARVGVNYYNLESIKAKLLNVTGASANANASNDLIQFNNDGEAYVQAFPIGNYHSKKYFLNGKSANVEDLLEQGFAPSLLGINKKEKSPVIKLLISKIVSIK